MSEKIFSVIEYSSHYAIRLNSTGEERPMGDGVDSVFDSNGDYISPGDPRMIPLWEEDLNEYPEETLNAYFPLQFEVVNHGIDNPQYFQGCGVYGTEYQYVDTGCGHSEASALDDALEQIAQATPDGFAERLEDAILEQYGKPSEDQIPWEEFGVEFNDDGDPIDDDGELTDYPDLYFYISIRYNP